MGLQSLQELIPVNSGWDLEASTSINDRGQIVGYGIFNGDNRAFLLMPIPEPISVTQFIFGTLFVMGFIRTRGSRHR